MVAHHAPILAFPRGVPALYANSGAVVALVRSVRHFDSNGGVVGTHLGFLEVLADQGGLADFLLAQEAAADHLFCFDHVLII